MVDFTDLVTYHIVSFPVCSASVNVDELIKVQFTGVSIATNHAASCLNRITGSPVKLKLLYKNEHSAIECIVHSWRSRWFYYVWTIIHVHTYSEAY